MSESNAVRFRDESEKTAVAVETPRPTLLNEFESWLVMTIEEPVIDATRRVLIMLDSSASEPNHCVATTVTKQSGRIPRTAALGWSSSSFTMFDPQKPHIAWTYSVASAYEHSILTHDLRNLLRSWRGAGGLARGISRIAQK